jgi:hypothetical protein
MAVKLNQRGYKYAKKLILENRAVLDARDWSKHQPNRQQENGYLKEQGIEAYGRWFLGIDDTKDKDTKGHYKFLYGDFKEVHRCAVLAAESRAGQYKYDDIERAAAHLHGMLDNLRDNGFLRPQDW